VRITTKRTHIIQKKKNTSCYQLAIDMRFSLLDLNDLTNCWNRFCTYINIIVNLKLWLVRNVGWFVNCSEQYYLFFPSCHCHHEIAEASFPHYIHSERFRVI
jgi:hypothetical protein